MPAVLGTLVISALLASAVAQQAKTSYALDVEHHRRTGEDWLLQAGLNRAVKALVTPGDPMREALFSARPTTLDWGGARILLAMSGESEKVDVDVADPEMVMDRLALALPQMPSEEMAHIAARLADLRAKMNLLPSPELLLPLDRRSSSVSDRLRQVTTTLSGQRYPSPPREGREADDDMVEKVQDPSRLRAESDGTPSRPIYRLTATMMVAGPRSGAVPSSASVVIVLSVNDARTFKIAEGHL